MYCYEVTNSQPLSDDGAFDRIFVVLDVVDQFQAVSLAFARADVLYNGNQRADIPTARPLGYAAWEITFKYSPPEKTQQQQEPQGESPTLPVLDFDTSGATQHITTALAQSHYPESAADAKRTIGADFQGGVEGTDIVIPDFRFSLSHKWTAAGFQAAGGGDYLFSLYRLTGKTNKSAYTARGYFQGVEIDLPFEAGELLFLGASGGGDGESFPIRYSFAASQNRTDLSISTSVTGISKKGHQYMWVAFSGSESQSKLVQTPIAAYVATVYEEDDFPSVLKF